MKSVSVPVALLFGATVTMSSLRGCCGFVPRVPRVTLPNPARRSGVASLKTMSLDVDQVKTSLTPVLRVVQAYSPFIVTYGLVFTVLQNMKAGGSPGSPFNSMNGLGKTPGNLLEESEVTFDDVAGCDYAKRELEEIVDFMKDPSKYDVYGAKLPRGVLLSSQPGMGKTLMAKALAGESGVPLIATSASEFVSIFVGNGPRRVKEVYEMARKVSPCFVFIDEIDSVASQRGGLDERRRQRREGSHAESAADRDRRYDHGRHRDHHRCHQPSRSSR